MKKEKLVIYLSELLLLIYIIMFKNVILKFFGSYVNVINMLFLILLLIIVSVFLGIPKKIKLINYNAVQSLVICFIIYYFLTYLVGMFIGFLSNSYSLKILSIINNVVIALLMYGFKEVYRYTIIKKSNKNYISIVIVTLLMAFLDIVMQINAYSFDGFVQIFEFVEACLVPNLALSFLLSYISYNFNYKIGILFLVLYDLPKFVLPIFPDFGIYIDSMVRLIFIFVCYYQLSILVEKYELKKPKLKKKQNNYVLVIFVVPILMLVGVVSGIFKYHLFAIGSNSMIPYFSKGDAVLIEKIEEEHLKDLKVEEVIAFRYNGQILVHRIVSIDADNGYYKIKTKGDNNYSVDTWIVDNDDVYGRVKFVVKYIGIPSVEFSKLIK